jgi:hypothetical protein
MSASDEFFDHSICEHLVTALRGWPIREIERGVRLSERGRLVELRRDWAIVELAENGSQRIVETLRCCRNRSQAMACRCRW